MFLTKFDQINFWSLQKLRGMILRWDGFIVCEVLRKLKEYGTALGNNSSQIGAANIKHWIQRTVVKYITWGL